MKTKLTEKVLKTTRNYDMLKAGDTVLAAVSGGPDSVFLLLALRFLKDKLKIKRIVVCNLDHGLRGAESSEDSLFVEKLAEDSGVDYIHKRIDLAKVKPKDISTEEAAREERYNFFIEAAKSVRANVVATGHTLDDQAETLLMRIIKGASLKGLVGIKPVREAGGIRIVRPLFDIEKKEIESYLDERAVSYRVDSSNLKPLYFRNIVRADILPYLEKYNPKIKRALSGLAEHLREDFEFISHAKKDAMEGIEEAMQDTDEVELKLKDIVTQPKAVQKEVLRDLLEKAGGEVKKLSFRHWKELEALISHKDKGSSLDLPGDIRVTRTFTALVFRRRP